MTPIEQDKELREKLIELDGELWDYQLDKLVQFITADRKRVVLEARLDELESLEKYYVPEDDYAIYPAIESRIAELKAQLEEV